MWEKAKRAMKAWLYEEGKTPVSNQPDPPPKHSWQKRFLAASIGTVCALAVVIVVLELILGDRRLSDGTIRLINSFLLPLPFVFWAWPELILRPVERVIGLFRTTEK